MNQDNSVLKEVFFALDKIIEPRVLFEGIAKKGRFDETANMDY